MDSQVHQMNDTWWDVACNCSEPAFEKNLPFTNPELISGRLFAEWRQDRNTANIGAMRSMEDAFTYALLKHWQLYFED